jgi:hypothetical protein
MSGTPTSVSNEDQQCTMALITFPQCFCIEIIPDCIVVMEYRFVSSDYRLRETNYHLARLSL